MTDNVNLYFSVNHKTRNYNKIVPPFYKDIHNPFMKLFKIKPNTAQGILE